MLNETQRRTLGASLKQLLDFLLKQGLTRLIELAVRPMSEACNSVSLVLLFMRAHSDLMRTLSADVELPSEVRAAWITLDGYAAALASLHTCASASYESADALLRWLHAPSSEVLDAVSFFNPGKKCFFHAPANDSGQWYDLDANCLVEKKPKRASLHPTLRVVGTKQQLVDFEAAYVACKTGPSVGVPSRLRETPNYNPSCLLDMAFFTSQLSIAPELAKLARAVREESAVCLVHLRELFLEMTPLGEYSYGVDYNVFTFRIATCPLNLTAVGPTPEPGEIGRDAAVYVEDRLEAYAETREILRAQLSASAVAAVSTNETCQGDAKSEDVVALLQLSVPISPCAAASKSANKVQLARVINGAVEDLESSSSSSLDLIVGKAAADAKQATEEAKQAAEDEKQAAEDLVFEKEQAERTDALFKAIIAKRLFGLFVATESNVVLTAEFERAIVVGADGKPCLYAERTLGISPAEEFALCCLQAKASNSVAMNNLALFFCMPGGQLGFPVVFDATLGINLLRCALAMGSPNAANNRLMLTTSGKPLLADLRKLKGLAARHNVAFLGQDRRAMTRLAVLYPPSAFAFSGRGLSLPASSSRLASYTSWAVARREAGLLGLLGADEADDYAQGLSVLEDAAESWDPLAILLLTGLRAVPERAQGYKGSLAQIRNTSTRRAPLCGAVTCDEKNSTLTDKSNFADDFASALRALELDQAGPAGGGNQVSCFHDWRAVPCRLRSEVWCERALVGGCADLAWLFAAARAYVTLRLRCTTADLELVLREIARRSRVHAVLLADYLSSIRAEALAFQVYLDVASAETADRDEAIEIDAQPQASIDKAAVLVALCAPRMPVFAMCENASRSDLECVCIDSFDGMKGAFALVEQRRPGSSDCCWFKVEDKDSLVNIYLGETTLVLKAVNVGLLVKAAETNADASEFGVDVSKILSSADAEQILADAKDTACALLLPATAQMPCAMGQVVLPLDRLPRFEALPECRHYPPRSCELCPTRGASFRTAHEDYAVWSAAFWAGYTASAAKLELSAATFCVRRAMIAVARRLDAGVGIKRDGVEALTWWRRAAQAGSSEAQFELGLAYRDGRRGVRKQGAQAAAATWFEAAARQGNESAQLALQDLRSRQLYKTSSASSSSSTQSSARATQEAVRARMAVADNKVMSRAAAKGNSDVTTCMQLLGAASAQQRFWPEAPHPKS